ncbi:transposase family protein [Kocuria palustris]|uniref:transposase family protein n=2 Tax=Kocuria palustris TaxID=71999 RepID=UPI00332CB990
MERGARQFTVVVETVPPLVGCPSCAVLATGHGRRKVLLHDLPCAGVPVRVRWRKRIYRCLEDACEISTFSGSSTLSVVAGVQPAFRAAVYNSIRVR